MEFESWINYEKGIKYLRVVVVNSKNDNTYNLWEIEVLIMKYIIREDNIPEMSNNYGEEVLDEKLKND